MSSLPGGNDPLNYLKPDPKLQPKNIIAVRAPTSSDRRYAIGQKWIDKANNKAYIMTSAGAGGANWESMAGDDQTFDELVATTSVTSPLLVATTSVTSPIYTAPSGETFQLNAASGESFLANLGDAAGSTNFTFNNSSFGSLLRLDSLGNLSMVRAGAVFSANGGAATDFIGQATLVSGTVTVANTNIAAGDRVFVSREGVGSSTDLGVLNVSISASTSFTITALQPGTPGSTQTGDLSIVNYWIVRQT